MKINTIILASVVTLLFGCNENELTVENISRSTTILLNDPPLSFSLPIEALPIEKVDAVIWSVQEINQDKSFSFSDIRFTFSGNNWHVSNYGPQPLSYFIVRHKGESLALIVLNNPLPAYSQAFLTFPPFQKK